MFWLISLDELRGILPIVALWAFILGFFYLVVMRPQAKRNKDHRDLMDSLEKGDRVVTAGGIHGSIVRTKGDIIYLDIGKGIIMRLDRGAIRRKEGDED